MRHCRRTDGIYRWSDLPCWIVGETDAATAEQDTRSPPALRAVALYLSIRMVGLVAMAVLASLHGRPLIEVLTKWDGQWYAGIAQHGYGFVRHHPDGRLLADFVFFPLVPLLERCLNASTGIDPAVAGVAISLVSAPLAAWGIYRCVERTVDVRTAVITVVLWGSLPVASIQTMAYTESLFTALAAWSLYFCLTQRWLAAAGLASAAALARPTGVAVTAAVLVAITLAVRHEGRFHVRYAAGAAIALVGSVAYPGWVGARSGSITGYFQATSGWGNRFDGGRAFAVWVSGQPPVVALLILAGVAGLTILFVNNIKMSLPAPLITYTLILLLLSFGTSAYFGSKPRYLVPAFVLLVPVAHWLARRPAGHCWTVLAALAAVSVGYGSLWLLGPGPP